MSAPSGSLRQSSAQAPASSAVYFAIVFGAGFVLGAVRVMWLVPRVGVRAAELTELPLMVLVVFFAARWVNRRLLAGRDHASPLIVGLTAFALLFLSELILGVIVLDMALKDVLLSRDPVSGLAYYLSLLAFALMPWCLGHMDRRCARRAARMSA